MKSQSATAPRRPTLRRSAVLLAGSGNMTPNWQVATSNSRIAAGDVAEPQRVAAARRTLWKTADQSRVRRITYVG